MARVRRKLSDVAWRTTFIVGFPTETDQDFEELVNFVSEGHFQHLGIFLYSDEDNIRSSKFGDPIPLSLKEDRKNRPVMKIPLECFGITWAPRSFVLLNRRNRNSATIATVLLV